MLYDTSSHLLEKEHLHFSYSNANYSKIKMLKCASRISKTLPALQKLYNIKTNGIPCTANLPSRLLDEKIKIGTRATSNDSTDSSNTLLTRLEPPTNLCCMEGCVNCVWIEYVENMAKEYSRKNQTLDIQEIIDQIENDISDPNVRAFIILEVKSKTR